jgi:hypothetical protein
VQPLLSRRGAADERHLAARREVALVVISDHLHAAVACAVAAQDGDAAIQK